VVTSAEAGRAIGQTVSSGVLGTALGGQARACVFYGPSSPTPTDPDVAQADTARVVVVEGPDAATFYNAYKTSANVHPQAVTGYGDEAFYDGSASLSVLTGDAYLRIAVSPPGAPPSLTDEGHLASLILPKL
jgi:hypothetical protein